MPQNLNDPTALTVVQGAIAPNLVLVDHRNIEVGGEKDEGSAEIGRRYAQDGERMPVNPDDMAHHSPIALKVAVPIRITEHDVGGAVHPPLIGRMEEAAKVGLN